MWAVRFQPQENRFRVQFQSGCYGFCNLRSQCLHKLLCKGCGWSVCVCMTQLCRDSCGNCRSLETERRKGLTSTPSGCAQRSKWNNSDSSQQDPIIIPDMFCCHALVLIARFLSTPFSKGPTSWLNFAQSNLQTQKKVSTKKFGLWVKSSTVDKQTLKKKLSLNTFFCFMQKKLNVFLLLWRINKDKVTRCPITHGPIWALRF